MKVSLSITFYKEKKFKETPIGKIPENWEIIKFGDVCRFKRGFSYRSDQITKDPTKIRFITINDFEKEGGLKRDAEKVYIREDVDVNSDFFLNDGDVLIANTDMSKGFIIGAPILIKSIDGKLVYSMDLTRLIFNKFKVDSTFLFYYLTHETVRRKMKSFAQGTNVLHLNHELVKNMKISLPPLPEQKAIAQILSTVDEAIQKTDEIIEKTKRLKKGLMQELLTRGFTVGFMFDTNIFDEILDGKVELPENLRYYVTHLQRDEILNIPEHERERKEKLLKIFNVVQEEIIPTEGFVVGVSRLNLAKLMSREDSELYNKMFERLTKLDKEAGKLKSPENRARDILIALTCLKNCLTLVTNDNNLKKAAQEFQCPIITFKQLLNGEYREFKDTEIGKIPKEWKVVKLENIASIKGRIGWHGLRDEDYLPEGEYYLVRGIDFRDGKVTWKKCVYVSKEWYERDPNIQLKEGDILITKDGTIGKVALVETLPKKATLGTGIFRIRVKTNKCLPHYLYYVFESLYFERFVQVLSAGSTLSHLYQKDLVNFKFPLPSLLEQQKIAEILLTVDKRLEVERKRKEKLERIKKGLMDLLLTGRVRVKVG